jgi:hypothetical protein
MNQFIKSLLPAWIPGLRFNIVGGGRRRGLRAVAALGLLGGISYAQQPLVIMPDGNSIFSGTVAIGKFTGDSHSHLNWPLAIRGNSYSNLLMFEDEKGAQRYHINLNKDGFNLWEITNPTTHAVQTRLFIAPKTGNVGIGTNTPTDGKKLDVVGDTQFTGNVNLKGILTGDRVGIGTPTPTAGKNLDVVGDTQFSGNMNLKGALTAGNPIATATLYPNMRLAVGGDVLVGGNVMMSGTINGEQPGIKFRINAGGRQRNATVVDIQNLCGDQDGCRIRVLMHHNNGSLRVLMEDIFIADPSWPKFEGGGLRGTTQPSDTGRRDWSLDTNNRATIFEATDWCKGTNFVEANSQQLSVLPTKLALNTATSGTFATATYAPDKTFRGNDKYRIAFSCISDVTADFIIYDR